MPFTSKEAFRKWRIKRYTTIRSQIIQKLGGQCAYCGGQTQLEFDHIFGTDWVLNKVSSYERVLRIRTEAQNGLIQLLCRECNAKKGDKPVGQSEPDLFTDEPY